MQGLLFETMAQTSQNDGMTFTLAVSYGSRMEIIDAVQRLYTPSSARNCTPRRLLSAIQQFLVYPSGCPTRSLDSAWRRTTFEQFPPLANLLYRIVFYRGVVA